MAQTIEAAVPAGIVTPTAKLYALGSTTAFETAASVVEFADGGVVTITLSGSTTAGTYRLNIFEAGTSIAEYKVDVKSAGVFQAYDATPAIERLQGVEALIESQRGGHIVQGNIYFVDPTNGDTHANGNRGGPDDPYSLIQDCHDNAVTDSNHDLIYLVSGASGGVTTATETVTLSKRYLQVRGPGRDFILVAASNATTVSITADGICLSGFRIQTTGAGTGKGVQASGADFVGLRNMWVENTRGDGINLDNCKNAVVTHCNLQGCGQSGAGDGININAGAGENSSYCRIIDNYIEDTSGDGIVLDTTGSGTITSTSIIGNRIFNATGSGIDIVDSGTLATVIADNRFASNLYDFTNASTSATYVFNDELVETVWLDTNNGDDGDPGTASQPVATLARAKAIADDLNKNISLLGGSSVTLAASYDSYVFNANGSTIALGGQSISGTVINDAIVSGTATGANRPEFVMCEIGTATLPPCRMTQTSFQSLTAGSAGQWDFDFTSSGVAGLAAATFNLNSTDNNTVGISNYARGITMSGLAANDIVTLNGVFNTITLNGADATVNISGQYGTLTNSLTGSPTVSVTNAFKSGDISDASTLQTDWADGGRLDLILDDILVDTGTTLPAQITSATYVSNQTNVSRSTGTTLTAYVGENVTFPPLTPLDVDGTTLDTTAITLEVVIENKDKSDVVVVADGSITKTATTIQFASTTAANTSEAIKRWSVRRTDTDVVVGLHGEYVVEYAATGD